MATIDPMLMRALMANAAKPQQRDGGGRVFTYNPRAQLAAAQAAQEAQGQDSGGWAGVAAAKGIGPRPGGAAGILGNVLNNPVSKALLTPLKALDVPRRVVISGLQEYIDAIGSGDASLSDFANQVQDSSFGFGDVAGSTGNKWLDRGIGFVGDVALDPMTYLTFGAGKFAGQAGRIAAATKLAEAGVEGERLAQVGRLGVLGAKGAEREAIFAGLEGADELAKPGLRLAGARIPGTGKFAETVGEGLAKTRAALADTRLGSTVGRTRAPEGLEDAYKVLKSGKGDTRSAVQAIAGTGRLAGDRGMFEARWASASDKLARDVHKSDGKVIAKMLEGEIPMEGETGARARQFLDDVLGEVQEVAPNVPARENYVPHQYTPEFRAKLKEMGENGIKVDGVTMDLTSRQGSALRRNIGPGSTIEFPDGSTVKIDTGFISEINQKVGQHLGIDKVLEDDFSKMLHPYVTDMAETVGRAGMVKRIEEIGTPGAGVMDTIDKAATEAKIAKALKGGERTLKGAAKDIPRTAAEMGKAAKTVRQEAVTALEGRLGASRGQLAALGGDTGQALRAEKGLEAARTGVSSTYDAEMKALDQQLADIGGKRGEQLKSELAERADIEQGKAAGKRARDADRAAAKRELASAQRNVDEAYAAAKAKPSGPARQRVLDAWPRVRAAEQRLAGIGGTIPETEAAREASEALTRRVEQQTTELDAHYWSVRGSMDEAERKASRDAASIDAARDASRKRRIGNIAETADINKDIAETQAALKRAKAAKLPATKNARAATEYDKLGQELEAVARDAGTYAGSETTRDLLAFHATGVARLTKAQESEAAAQSVMKALGKGELTPVLKSIVKDGYERLGADLLGEADAPIVRAELTRQLENFNRTIKDQGFWKVIDNYTKFFKTYATATPGFHLRNGMSAAFMNASDGVSVTNMTRGYQMWGRFERNPQSFLEQLPKGVSEQQAKDALQAVFQSGGGSGAFGFAEIRLGKNPITNNPLTRASQHAGGRVEGYARLGMALDTILEGGTVEQAAARISRIHFNYSEVSKLDQSVKRVIPFWTFMSRNVPLQLQQMWLRPQMYQNYKSLVRNMGQDYTADMVPKSWQDAGAFKVADNTNFGIGPLQFNGPMYLAPDLPFTRLEDELNKLSTDPQRLLADANPIFKVPFETLIAKRQLYSDRPFDANGKEQMDEELAPFGAILKMLGQAQTSRGGDTVADERWAYALRNLIPPLSQYQRLIGDDPYMAERRGQNVSGYLGLPIKSLNPAQQRAEAKRRANELATTEAARKALAEFTSGR